MFSGMKDRVKRDVQALTPSPYVADVDAPADRKHLCWLGGATLASIPKFNQLYISRKDYEEYGKNVVHRKCF